MTDILMESLPEDYTVDEVRTWLPPFIAHEAAFDGWSDEALTNAANGQGIDPAIARLAFPDGAIDMVDQWILHIDAKMQRDFSEDKLSTMKIRSKITELVWYRFTSVKQEKEALRRAIAILALPVNLKRAGKISWRTADLIWRMAGDTATDYNHYTKRTILTGVYSSTLMHFLDDDSEDHAETRAFLERRIENVMQFEKVKAKWLNTDRESFDLASFLGRLRYPGKK
ncbi:COQ9 family protein [Parasphingorhabdus sp. DH2-15]|uniref:COQ9 family protein n=1 Tax=Parasphingorhabdus sp. DH2-15 TaxID=3444112 RepID=UPI003F683CCA